MPVFWWVNTNLQVNKPHQNFKKFKKRVNGKFKPPILKKITIIYIKNINIYYKIYNNHIKKINWGIYLKTTKHRIAYSKIVVKELKKEKNLGNIKDIKN